MRCLESVNVDGVNRALMQINDFSIIPASVVQSTQFVTEVSVYSSSSKASYVTDSGYDFYKSTKANRTTTQRVAVSDNRYFTLNCPSGPYYKPNGDYVNGLKLYDNVTGELVAWWGLPDGSYGSSSSAYRSHYIGIVLDDDNRRGYLLVQTDAQNCYSANGWRISVLGGAVNGVDYIYEIFGNPANQSGGAGSGYIGNSLLSNKKMVGYNVPTSSAEATKTESVNVYSAIPETNKPKEGNGYARIRFLGDSPTTMLFNISATDSLRDSINNKTPSVIEGSMGVYDSATQSYYFSNGCYLGYDSKITKSQLQSATKLKLEMNVKTDSEVYGDMFDTEIGVSTSAVSSSGYDFILAGKVCNGSYDPYSSGKHIALLNGGNYLWQGNAPEDVSANQGAFHIIVHEFTLSSGTVTKIKVTVDGIQFSETNPNVALSLSNDNYYFVVGICDKTSIKSAKVVVE